MKLKNNKIKMEAFFDKKALYYASKVLLDPKASLTEEEEELVVDSLDNLGIDIDLDWSDRVLSDVLINFYLKQKGIPAISKRIKMRHIVEEYELPSVAIMRPEPPSKKRTERPKTSASDNIICEKLPGTGGFYEVFLDDFLESGISVSTDLFAQLFDLSEEPILKLQTQTHICFARPTINGNNDDRQKIGISRIVGDVLEWPRMLKEVSICHGFPLIGKVAVSGEGTSEMDLEQISEEVTKLQVLFIGLLLFEKRVFVSKLYNALDGSEMDVGKIALGDTEIPIEVFTPSNINRKIGWRRK